MDLELNPWSSSSTEIGLRPLGRRIPTHEPTAMIRAGDVALNALAEAMISWANEPLRAVLAMSTSVAPGD
ncbi:hypothetical protein ACSMXN_23005 [Jatrophihabitans sp. DSM 45814]